MSRARTLTAGVVCACLLAACANPDDGAEGSAGSHTADLLTEVARDPALAAMVPPEIARRGSVTAAVNPSSPPIKFLDGAGRITGFTPRLVAAAGKMLGLDVVLQQTSFDALIPGLEARRFDLVLSVNDLAGRREKTDFIDYLRTGTAILGASTLSRDSVTPQTLCGLSMGYVRGNVQQDLVAAAGRSCARAGAATVSGSAFQDLNAAILAVQSGQMDAAWGDAPSISYNAEKNPGRYKVLYREISGPYGIGVGKQQAALRDALRAALLKCVRDGIYQRLLEDYGLTDYALPELPLNTGPADDAE
ncbi:transporter substrate-binding domain-containing protein [Amycolatopsis jiangsuensis]|uniref:ABC-type amino acid transport substrate-binding protein n=1 Tax=Amycolatopsis jiangsuensis TaxID=1181879 RepID=A0A840ISG0_9PSEU|nr:transporter substrate-binding domain-containing protein [Amycolatopsis jiangsuensis]MBB4684088.1 ABC-type amino acid transport substrate-binding protein [Amycolatopsis jiangsuensis]